MIWKTLFQKEVVENWRNFKWIWVPLVLILLAIMDPITMHYMPVILENFGGLPDGTVLEMPTPSTTEIIMMSMNQLNTIGLLVIVLMSMGTIANERKSGVLELTLVKPVSFTSFITAKWTALLTLTSISMAIALLASWYYTNLLFEPVAFSVMVKAILFFVIWFAFVVSLIILFSTMTKSAGVVAALSIGTIIVLSTVTSTFPKYLAWSPSRIPTYIQEVLYTNSISTDFMMTLGVTVIAIVGCLWVSVICMEKKEIS